MTLQRLNPHQAESAEARGYMAPYVRVATHIGYDIAWIGATTDAEWAEPPSESTATRDRIREDLAEAHRHLILNSNMDSPSAFVGEAQVGHMLTLKNQVAELQSSLAENRSDALLELQVLADNLAYAAAQYEYHVSGNADVSEGRNA
jgi:hypothetical protein